MPSTKKRINLTVPDSLYDRLQLYKEKMGITNDASACLQLVTLQLNAQEQSAILTKLIGAMSPEQIRQITAEGMEFWQTVANAGTNNSQLPSSLIGE